MSKSQWVINVTEATFQREVLERSKERPVVVDFWAPWCGPCRMLAPLLEKLAAERNGDFVLAKVNTDENPGLAAAFRIEGIPAVKAFHGGRLVMEFVGVLPEPQLREAINRICPSEVDKLAVQAAGREAADPAEAERLYRQVLEQDRKQELALIGLARLLVGRGQDAEAAELLGRLPPGGPFAAEADRLNGILALRKQAAGLGDEAKLRQRVEAEPNAAKPRYELGCVLAAAGKYPEALAMLLSAAERDRNLAKKEVREAMLKVFQVVGVRSDLADDYRDRLRQLLY
ncbi:MAG TPA: thioredoxin [Gemmataceae bacterium]|nr:thioredoxin [Gemmataceae bacterium]